MRPGRPVRTWRRRASRCASDKPLIVARDLLRAHRDTYRTFWRWSDAAVDTAMLTGSLHTVFGWHVHVGETNPRHCAHFPMQAKSPIQRARLGLQGAHEARRVSSRDGRAGRVAAAAPQSLGRAAPLLVAVFQRAREGSRLAGPWFPSPLVKAARCTKVFSELEAVWEVGRKEELQRANGHDRDPDAAEVARLRKRLGPERARTISLLATLVADAVRPLHQRIAQLEARPQLEYCGTYAASNVYARGNICTHHGSCWHCNHQETSDEPGRSDAWSLMVKRGRDAK